MDFCVARLTSVSSPVEMTRGRGRGRSRGSGRSCARGREIEATSGESSGSGVRGDFPVVPPPMLINTSEARKQRFLSGLDPDTRDQLVGVNHEEMSNLVGMALEFERDCEESKSSKKAKIVDLSCSRKGKSKMKIGPPLFRTQRSQLGYGYCGQRQQQRLPTPQPFVVAAPVAAIPVDQRASAPGVRPSV